jgi:protein SCO1/2
MPVRSPGSSAGPRAGRAAAEALGLGIAAAVVALVALLLVTPSSRTAPAQAAASPASNLRFMLHGVPAPPIDLRDQRGRPTSIADLHGRVVLLTFLDSHCTNLCPIEGGQLAQVQRRFPVAQRPELVVVSVNPADTRRSVARFVREAGWTTHWRWLFGSRSALAPVWRAYHIGVRTSRSQAVVVGSTTIQLGGGIVHTTALYVIDPNGREQFGYLPPFRPAAVAAQIGALDRS